VAVTPPPKDGGSGEKLPGPEFRLLQDDIFAMTLLSAIFRIPRNPRDSPSERYARDERDAVRHDANIPVTIQARGMPPVTGSVINISVRGAAIRIEHATWLFHLSQGDELGLTGVLDLPVSCWVVVFDEEVLRVHFAPDDEVREQLRMVIGLLAAPRNKRAVHALVKSEI
jgi:PilZ domain